MSNNHKFPKLKIWRVTIYFFLPVSKSWKGKITPKGKSTITVRCYTKNEANDIAEKYIKNGRIQKVPYQGKTGNLDTIIQIEEQT